MPSPPMSRVLSLSIVASLFSLLTVACATEVDDPESDVDAFVQGGAFDTGDLAVGLLTFVGGTYCTGTLIAPNVVLTAAHCITSVPTSFSTAGYGNVKHAVLAAKKASGFLGGFCPNPTHDVALVQLAAPITEIAPIAYGAAVPKVGTSCRVIGYGSHLNDSGTTLSRRKFAGTSTISSLSGDTIKVKFETAIADSGDSGGPLLCNDSVVGVVSCHTDGDYPAHKSEYYERVSSLNTWVKTTIAAWAP